MSRSLINATPRVGRIYDKMKEPRRIVVEIAATHTAGITLLYDDPLPRDESVLLNGGDARIPLVKPCVPCQLLVPAELTAAWFDPSVMVIVTPEVAAYVAQEKLRTNVVVASPNEPHAIRTRAGDVVGTLALEQYT